MGVRLRGVAQAEACADRNRVVWCQATTDACCDKFVASHFS